MNTFNCPMGLSLECYVCAKNKAQTLQTQRSSAKHGTSVDNKKLLDNEYKTPEVICKGCKVQRYCSLAHLLKDRPEHQDLCRVLRALLKSQKLEHPLLQHGVIVSQEQLQLVITQLKFVLRVKLRRPLTPREQHVISNPAICAVCFRTEAPLEICKGCGGVAYCSEAHHQQDAKKHTPKECRTLALISSPFRQLDCTLNLKTFHQCVDMKNSNLADAFFKATALRTGNNPHIIATCSSFSGIASTCLALTNISWVSDQYSAVIVYVVAATEEHLRYFQEMHLRFFFLQYQSIQNLELYFIGPKLVPRESTKEVFRLQGLLRTVAKHFYPETFTTFSKVMKVDPTLILLLQPDFINMATATEQLVKQLPGQGVGGAVDFDWQSCLGSLLRTYGVPICFTSPTKSQAMSDFIALHTTAIFENITIERMYNITENPYRELLPLYNFADEQNERIVYTNNYLEVVFTSIKKI